jgi:uncharacterized surface protein with fasciclin (FAS1) repeats
MRSPVIVAAAVILSLAGCGPATASREEVVHGAFGPACDKLPASGRGSVIGMATEPVATAASHDPILSDLARAIRAAGLTRSLNSARAITVFAPDNSAFADLGIGNLTALMTTKSDLIKVVEFHVVHGRRTPADLASGHHLTTVRGTVIIPARSHGEYTINNARVVCGNIRTANATVYIVDKVLVPLP